MYENQPQVKPKHVAAFVVWGIALLIGFSALFLIIFPAGATEPTLETDEWFWLSETGGGYPISNKCKISYGYYNTTEYAGADFNEECHFDLQQNMTAGQKMIVECGSTDQASPSLGNFKINGVSYGFFEGATAKNQICGRYSGSNTSGLVSFWYAATTTTAVKINWDPWSSWRSENIGCRVLVYSGLGNILATSTPTFAYGSGIEVNKKLSLNNYIGLNLLPAAIQSGAMTSIAASSTLISSNSTFPEIDNDLVNALSIQSLQLPIAATTTIGHGWSWTGSNEAGVCGAFFSADYTTPPPPPPPTEYATTSEGIIWVANPTYCELGDDCLVRVNYNDRSFFDEIVLFYSGGLATTTPSPVWQYTDFFATSTEATSTTYYAYGYKNGVYIDGQVLTLIVFQATTSPYIAKWCADVCASIGSTTANTLWDDVKDGLECAARTTICWAFNPHEESKNHIASGWEHLKRSFPLNAYFDLSDAFIGLQNATTSDDETLGAPMIDESGNFYMIPVIASSTFEDTLGSSTYSMVQTSLLSLMWIAFGLYIIWRVQHH